MCVRKPEKQVSFLAKKVMLGTEMLPLNANSESCFMEMHIFLQ
jgi:hypothetical protein